MSWGAEALRCAGHGGGEVAATELAGVSVAREGGVQREGKWVQGFAEVPREAVGETGGGLRPPTAAATAPAAVKQRGREVEDEVWTDLQNLKSSRVPL